MVVYSPAYRNTSSMLNSACAPTLSLPVICCSLVFVRRLTGEWSSCHSARAAVRRRKLTASRTSFQARPALQTLRGTVSTCRLRVGKASRRGVQYGRCFCRRRVLRTDSGELLMQLSLFWGLRSLRLPGDTSKGPYCRGTIVNRIYGAH